MSHALYCDQHVPGPIALGLRRRGIEVVTAEEDGTKRLDDERLLARATSLGRVLVSYDADFAVIAAAWQREGRPFAGIIRITRQDLPYGQLIDDLELIAKLAAPDEVANRILYLPL